MERIKLVVVGHVDHGKSTFIGRILYDTKSITEDKIKDVENKCKRLGKEFELAFLLDALEEEHEQTITIETTQISFGTKARNYLIIDAPGHKEFLKNMITGASNADVGVLIIDAEEGIQEQTSRHVYILKLLGINSIIVAINKMDKIKYSESGFNYLKEQCRVLLSRFDIETSQTIPISAKNGDNVSEKSDRMPWYAGLSFLDYLDRFSSAGQLSLPLRFPVQDIYNWGQRIIAGRVESGQLKVNDELIFCPSMKKANVKTIEKWGSSLTRAVEGECIGITLNDQIFIERGEIAVLNTALPTITQEFSANVFWIGPRALSQNKRYKIKLLSSETFCEVSLIKKRINSSTLEVIQENAAELHPTEVGEVVLSLEKPIAVDTFKDLPKSGRFVIVDEFDVSGGGIITNALGITDQPETS